MRIVVTGLRGFPNVQGGIETHCEELYPRIVNLGHEVIVVRRSGFVKENPALKVKLPKYDVPDPDPAHIFTKEEIDILVAALRNCKKVFQIVT